MTSEIHCIGLNHRQTPLSIREKVGFAPEQLSVALGSLKSYPQITEGLILSTCNRVELYAHCKVENGFDALQNFLAEFHRLHPDTISPHLYRLTGAKAAHQFFKVASSLDSLVLGEAQILGQVKSAISAARQADALGPHLNLMLDHGLRTAKRVRSETDLARHSISVSHIAVELSSSVFSTIKNRSTLLIGAGTMAEVAARCLQQKGARLHIANRTLENAQRLSTLLGAHPYELGQVENLLKTCDIVMTSTHALSYLFTKKQIMRLMPKRRYRPIFFVDIAVPRNVDPLIQEIDGVYLYNVDDLSRIADSRVMLRAEQGVLAEGILQEEIQKFEFKRNERIIAPLIADLRHKSIELAQEELSKLLKSIGERLSSDDELKIRRTTESIVNKILHQKIEEIKTQVR